MLREDLVRREEEVMASDERVGAVMATAGKLLLAFAFILCSFIYVGVRGGSHMWMGWVLLQGSVGLVLLGMGKYKLAQVS